jgi:hypothetical protein
VLAPDDDAPLIVGLLHGDVGHEPGGGGAVPVVFVWLEEDAVAGADHLDRAAAPLAQAHTPSVTQIVWPRGWVCHAVRAPGMKWTLAAPICEALDGAAIMSI